MEINITEIFEKTVAAEKEETAKIVADINCSIFNIVHKRLFKNTIEEGNVRHLAKSVCKLVKTAFEKEKWQDAMTEITGRVVSTIEGNKEREDAATDLFYTIATASDTEYKFSAIDASILILAAADFCGIKFAF